MFTPGQPLGAELVVQAAHRLPDGRWVGAARNREGVALRFLALPLTSAPVTPPAAIDAAVQRWQRQTHGLPGLMPLVRAGLVADPEQRDTAPWLWLAWRGSGAPTLVERPSAAPAEAARLRARVGQALEGLHGYGLVHGALLPELIERDGDAVLLGGHGVAAVLSHLAPGAATPRTEADDRSALAALRVDGDAPGAGASAAVPGGAAADASGPDRDEPHGVVEPPVGVVSLPAGAPSAAPPPAPPFPSLAQGGEPAAPASSGAAPRTPGPPPAGAATGILAPHGGAHRGPVAPRVFAALHASPPVPPAPGPAVVEPRAWVPWALGGLALLLMGGGVALALALSGRARAPSGTPGGAGAGALVAPSPGGGGAGGAGGGAPGDAAAPEGDAGGAPPPASSGGAGGRGQRDERSGPGGGPSGSDADPDADGGPFTDGPPPSVPALPEQGTAPPLVSAFDVRVGRRVGTRDDHRAALPIDDEVPLLGPELAPVTLLVFGDVLCPHTRRTVRDLARLRARDGRELRIAWRHRPLSVHAGSREAALALAAVAKRAGDLAFFRVLDAAARAPAGSSPGDWLTTAGVTGVDPGATAREPALIARLEDDLALAGRFDVRSTPTVFLNGHRVEGAVGVEVLRELVAAERTLAARTHAAVPESVYRLRVDANLIGLGVR